jgi:predicted small lipoprotein YifL
MIVLLLALAGCGEPAPTEPPPAPPEAAPTVDAGQAALDQADAAAKTLGKTLKEKLQGAMAEGGPKAAIAVCADSAQGLHAQVAGETNAKVGRSSLRLRNPNNAPPDWVGAWLNEQGEKKAADATGFARIDEVDGKQLARVVKPIAVEPLCVTCHGTAEQIPAEVKEVLASRYPTDAAVGYAEGDLRGAIWAEVEVR